MRASLDRPDDQLARQVGNVGAAQEGEQVVLAHRLHGDVAHQHELVVPLRVGERREVELRRAEQLGVRLGQPPGRARQVGAVRVVGLHARGSA